MKGMVGIGKELQRCARAELFPQRFQQRKVGQVVAVSLQEQHGHLHIKEMLAALVRWLARGVQRKAEEGEAAHAGQGRGGLRLRSHAPAERFSARNERNAWRE